MASRWTALSWIIASSVASAAGAQDSTAATFYLIRGPDTVVVERQTRTDRRLDADLLDRASGSRLTLGAVLAPGALISQMDLTTRAPAGDTTPRVTTFAFGEGTVAVTTPVRTTNIPVAPGTLPYINPSPSILEQLVLRSRALGAPTSTIPILLTTGTVSTAMVTWIGADSATITLGTVTIRLSVSPTGAVLGGIIPSQGSRIVRGGPVAAIGFVRRDYSAPAGAPYTAEDVLFRSSAGAPIAGTLTLPQNRAGRIPAVVTITGSGQEDRDESLPGIQGYALFRQVADTLGRRGIAVLRTDDRGVGGSGGDVANETSADYADDIRAAVAYLRTRPEIDPARIALIGHSEGGYVAPMVAATDSTIGAIVLMAGSARTGRRILEYQLGQQVERARVTETVRDSLRRGIPAQIETMARQPWVRFFLDYDPLPTARRVRAPVLILQGGHDIQVTPDQADELAAAIRAGGNARVTSRTFPDLNHLFVSDPAGDTPYAALPSKAVSPEALGALADWLSATLR